MRLVWLANLMAGMTAPPDDVSGGGVDPMTSSLDDVSARGNDDFLSRLLNDSQGLPSDSSSSLPSFGQVLNSYLVVFVVAFLVTLVVVPLIRRVALRSGIVDWPDDARKAHGDPVPYLGGVAVFLGMVAAIAASYFLPGYQAHLATVPASVVLGLVVIMLTGLIDDVAHLDPRLKIAGQLIAAAALALNPQIGERIALGLMNPIGKLIGLEEFNFVFDLMPGSGELFFNLPYWVGAFIIAAFVIGGCNAANLIDGLDGLLSGMTAFMAAGLLVISVMLAMRGYGELTAARVVICLALLGATLGFLPHNFKPATIFLGDAGSLMLGFSIIVVILMMGERGHTHLVFAGLIVFGLPIIDTVLAILRRRLNGLPISAPDNDHLHHILKRSKLGVVGAVFVMYGITALFGLLAIVMVVMRARAVYAVILVMTGFIVVSGIKAARRAQRRAEIETVKLSREGRGGSGRDGGQSAA
ncbi:MAG: undecaprenyl/decaprenyl-phosphate alpha-N-acetylglucosaminyl 1-phosphate transferase [Planctomycetes bacterium]|nr:undecaprenyl/decaprenyl-phosphate alpha-N-acetylglucosaminyl 1-phosphate transferase [Planctomycetota bacterium]NOG53530.1 undecaprenyl/decaprenyl-phosphate alpha-N-acetylglucosaminyl 1-phosphate transferase [Planctomycetota bacterium]